MALYILVCNDKPDSLPLRMATREAHLAYVREQIGQVKLAGPLSDAKGEMAGSFFILDVADIEAARAFNAADPYAKAGLFGQVQVTAFKATVGSLG